jgi:hypothetical protein
MALSEDEEFELLSLERERAHQSQPQTQPQPDNIGSFPEARAVINSDRPLLGKAWDAMQVPAQMSQRGLQTMADAVPEPEVTGNVPMDVIKGTPKILANTMAQAAPQFINRASLLTAGAGQAIKGAVPLAKAVGRGVANQAEQITGAVPGSVSAAFKDPTLIFAQGKKAAGPLYEAAKAEMAPGESIFAGMYKPEQIVDAARTYLDKGGKLEPAEGLVYRKAIDSLAQSKRYVKDELMALRSEADGIAKGSENIAKADPAYQRGRMAESLRNILPQNKYGGASAFKMGIMAALDQMGAPGKLAMTAMSPAAAGITATAAGAGTKAIAPIVRDPKAANAFRILAEEYLKRKREGSHADSR